MRDFSFAASVSRRTVFVFDILLYRVMVERRVFVSRVVFYRAVVGQKERTLFCDFCSFGVPLSSLA